LRLWWLAALLLLPLLQANTTVQATHLLNFTHNHIQQELSNQTTAHSRHSLLLLLNFALRCHRGLNGTDA
jgi:hypothetical protein